MNQLELETKIHKVSQDRIVRGLRTYSERYKHRTGQPVINTASSNQFPGLLFRVWKEDDPCSERYYINREGFNYDDVYKTISPQAYADYTEALKLKEEDPDFQPGNFYWYLMQRGYKMQSYPNPWTSGAPESIIDLTERILSNVPVVCSSDL